MNLQMLQIVTIHSPHFLLPYPNNVKCSWVFSSNEPGYFITKPGQTLRIEEFDSLTVGSGSAISVESVLYHMPRYLRYAPYKLVISSYSMWVLFTSDKYGVKSGFYLTVERSNNTGTAAFLNSHSQSN